MQASNVEPADQTKSSLGNPRHSQPLQRPSRLQESPRPLGSVRSLTDRRTSSPAQFPPHFVSPVTRRANTVACSPARQAREREKHRYSDDYVAETNFVNITGGGTSVDGLTLNNGGTNNSGAGVSFVWLCLDPPLTVERICSRSQDDNASSLGTVCPNPAHVALAVLLCLLPCDGLCM